VDRNVDSILWQRGFQCELMDVFVGVAMGTGVGCYNLSSKPTESDDMNAGAKAAVPLAKQLRENFDADPAEFLATHHSYELSGLDVARAFCATEASLAWKRECAAEDAHLEDGREHDHKDYNDVRREATRA